MSSLTELKELADKATPGPWGTFCESQGYEGDGQWYVTSPTFPDSQAIIGSESSNGDHDARYIAACSPEVVKALIAVAEIAERVDDARSPAIGLLNDLSAALDHLKGVLK